MTLRCPNCDVELDLRRKPKGADEPVDRHAILALLKFGATVQEVADLYGISRARVYYIRKKWAT